MTVVTSEILVNAELRELHYRKIIEPTFIMAEKYFQQWAEQHLSRPVDVPLTMRAIAGMVFGLILEYIMGDKTLEAKWDELPDFLTDLILDGIVSLPSLLQSDNEMPVFALELSDTTAWLAERILSSLPA